MAALVNLFKQPQLAFEKGVTIKGQKYFTIKADDRSIYGKKVPPPPVPGADGI